MNTNEFIVAQNSGKCDNLKLNLDQRTNMTKIKVEWVWFFYIAFMYMLRIPILFRVEILCIGQTDFLFVFCFYSYIKI